MRISSTFGSRFAILLINLLITVREYESNNCFFAPEFQGDYVMQNTILNDKIIYSHINISADSIPIWGLCHKRTGDNVILMIGSEETSCFRCFKFQLVAKNILLVQTLDGNYTSQCYTNEASVICPSDDTDEENLTEIILYRTKTWENLQPNREFCPFNGKFRFNYELNKQRLCENYESEVNFCPSGSALTVRYKKCQFTDETRTYECVGHWEGLNDQRYLALMDWSDPDDPKYRCAMYGYDNSLNTSITIKMSNDSTCASLRSHNSPFSSFQGRNSNNKQVFKLQKIKESFHQQETVDNARINYPDELQGEWQHLTVEKNLLTFKDHNSFKLHYMALINQVKEDKFIVLSRTQCDDENFKCVWIKMLDQNIIDFQIGSHTSSNLTSTNLCNDEYFDDSRWLTQGRSGMDIIKTACPINGKYSGMIPDAENLCAVLSSDCSNLDIMYYQVGACDYDTIYEKRTYRCLGQWTDKNKAIYTYTKRMDAVNSYECFVGAIIGSNKKITIKEAGESCHKHVNPFDFGMEMHQNLTCPNNSLPDHSIQPTQKDASTKYLTFSFDSNDIQTTSNNHTPGAQPKSTKNTKTTKKQRTESEENLNEISNETTYSHANSKEVSRIYLLGILAFFTIFTIT